jgi:hypothetical protein
MLLAAPAHRSATIPVDPNARSASAKLYAAWRAGERGRAETVLAELRERRKASAAAPDIMVDAIYGEAAVLSSLGNTRGALDWLSPTLDSLAFTETQALADMARAGPLVRAMALRAELAASLGDGAAARPWAKAVAELWSQPDEFLLPTVRRMKELAR